ncbi:MAG: PAS domain-containing protein [Deltaproteobacteria bacterium]|nr:PAS domain-containing protein [Deltaproteobacteria bacterium]
MEDHETFEKVFDAVAQALAAEEPPAPALIGNLQKFFVEYLDGCHNKKEEEHLFPLIEQRGVPRQGGPLAVMLMEHEQSKALLAEFQKAAGAYAGGDASALPEVKRVFGAYSELLKAHFWKENDILYPMARRVMSDEDGQTVVDGITATEAALGEDTHERYYALADQIIGGSLKNLVYGVPYELLGPMLDTLPLELSFVDAEDTVLYYSHENSEKIFPRTRGAIGTKVQNCHPPDSIDIVNRILDEFRAGTREVAEFWIEMGGKFIHIRYWPVRGPEGEYLGCLEAVQDVTGIRALTGQRRILDENG